jgi:hypothetical protein
MKVLLTVFGACLLVTGAALLVITPIFASLGIAIGANSPPDVADLGIELAVAGVFLALIGTGVLGYGVTVSE